MALYTAGGARKLGVTGAMLAAGVAADIANGRFDSRKTFRILESAI